MEKDDKTNNIIYKRLHRKLRLKNTNLIKNQGLTITNIIQYWYLFLDIFGIRLVIPIFPFFIDDVPF
jgi:hypothetical protein